MRKINKKQKIKELEEKLKKYEKKYEDKLKQTGELDWSSFSDAYSDQLYFDQKVLEDMITGLKEEIAKLKQRTQLK